jgi:hypothetical protein
LGFSDLEQGDEDFMVLVEMNKNFALNPNPMK